MAETCCRDFLDALEKHVLIPYVTFTENEAIGHPPQFRSEPQRHGAHPKPGMPIHFCPFCGMKLEDPAYIHRHRAIEVGVGRHHG